MTQTLFFITLGIYVAATVGFLTHILFRPRRLVSISIGLVILGFIVQTIGLGLSLPDRVYPFILSDNDAYILISWLVTLLFILLVRFFRVQEAGTLFMAAATCLLILSIFGGGGQNYEVSYNVSPWVLIHLLLAFLAFAAFVVSLIIGIAFILVEVRIKAKHLGRITRRLPSLEVLDNIHYKAFGMGIILLTFSIIVGTLMNKLLKGVFFTGDLKQIWVFGTWFLCLIFFEMRNRIGWRGRRGIILSVLGFIIVIMAFFGLQHGSNF